MDLGLRNKVIMVAASSKGLGFGVADVVAREGARVSLASRNSDNIQNAARKIRESCKTDARGYTFNASDPQSILDWTAATLNDFGSIDGLVVNAGGPPPGKFDKFDDVAWAQAFELTLMSAVRMIRAVLPTFRRKGSGVILTMTSTSIKEPIDLLLFSNVFRSGVVSLVKTLSVELAPERIRLLIISSRVAWIRTDFVSWIMSMPKGEVLLLQNRRKNRNAQYLWADMARFKNLAPLLHFFCQIKQATLPVQH